MLTPEREKEIRAINENTPIEKHNPLNVRDELLAEIDALRIALKYCIENNSQLRHEFRIAQASTKSLREKLDVAVEALEKISDPRKRDHKENDEYTQIGCLMNVADKALQKIRGENANS